MNNVPLSDLFHVKGRFQRSVHLERDFYSEASLNEYVLTVTAREMLGRIIATLENRTTCQAWSITGPYGAGKSAFALFAVKLFGNSDDPTTKQAMDLLRRDDPSLYERFISTIGNGKRTTSGFCPVLISGERAPLSLSLLRGLERALTAANGTLPSISLLQDLEHLLEKVENNGFPSVSEITNLYELVTQQICDAGGSGLLLVVDELGKFLEYATQHPEHGDMFILQNLAEFADRSKGTPLFLMTILHQAFESYAQRNAKSQREEWAKVQGRFEDIAFVEPTEQVLRLIGKALENRSEIACTHDFETAIELGLKPHQLKDIEYTQLLENCLPLHPIVALLIGPVFRRFAQNERSLFAFLSSSEPYGLQDFLSINHYDGNILPMYTLANLFDYLNSAHANRFHTAGTGKKWTEIESAINQLEDPSEMTIRLIKTIGILSVVSEPIPNLKATEELLRYSLDDKTEGFNNAFESALATLEKRSLIIHRRFNNTFALWEGSDIDIEEKLREAEKRVDTGIALAVDLSQYMPTRPFIARRHLYQTGTLRYFAVRYTDIENFDTDISESLGDADGLVLYALPTNDHEVAQLVEKARAIDVNTHNAVLIAIPRSIGFLSDAVSELANLHWVVENTPELDGDAVARRELSVRQIEAERNVLVRLTEIFGGVSEGSCLWYYKGELLEINTQRERNEYLSEICDQVYHKTPLIRNELINRRKISGAATNARRKLIRHMLENGNLNNLGITGYPAEMSIYRSLLWNTGIHRYESLELGFHPPKEGDNGLKYVWDAVEDYLEECEDERQPVENLYERLMSPPYGVRKGPLPILLCAAIIHYKTEVALYENGTFVADLSIPVFERFVKAPQQFELKRFRLAGIRADVFTQLLKLLNQPTDIENPDFLTVVAPLMRFIAQLSKYTLGTQSLSENAKKLRSVVQNAREPDELLFKQLPVAFGFSAFTTDVADSKIVVDFFNALQEALAELEQAYDALLNSIEKMLRSAFNLKTSGQDLRTELFTKASPMQEIAVDTYLKGFLIQLCSEGHDFPAWIEAIGTYLAKKPPSSWIDTDIAQFEINLSQLARRFRHFEAVSYEILQHSESLQGEPIRVGITTTNHPEQERVITLQYADKEHADKVEHAIEQLLDNLDTDGNTEFRLAVLARISQKLMQQEDESNQA